MNTKIRDWKQSHTLPSILKRISTRPICFLSYPLLSNLKQAVSIRNSVRIRYLPHFTHSRHSPHKTGQLIICTTVGICVRLTTQFPHTREHSLFMENKESTYLLLALMCKLRGVEVVVVSRRRRMCCVIRASRSYTAGSKCRMNSFNTRPVATKRKKALKATLCQKLQSRCALSSHRSKGDHMQCSLSECGV